MSQDLDRFIDHVITAPATVARCEAVIAQLEADVAHLTLVNRLLIEKIEWFAAYVGVSPAPPVVPPRAVEPWPQRREFVFAGIDVTCDRCGVVFQRTPRHKAMCKRCRGEVIADGLATKRRARQAATIEERIAV